MPKSLSKSTLSVLASKFASFCLGAAGLGRGGKPLFWGFSDASLDLCLKASRCFDIVDGVSDSYV